MNFKVIIMDRNGHTSKFVLKNEPIETDGKLIIQATPYYTVTFIVANLTSYSVTRLKPHRKDDKVKVEVLDANES